MKNDNDAIAMWRLDLNKILRILNVRLTVASVWSLLTFRFQAELEVNARVTDPDISHGVADTYKNILDVRRDVSNTHTVASDVHRNTQKSRRDTNDQTPVVSFPSAPPVAE